MNCRRCEGRGEWEQYIPELDEHETVVCPGCGGDGVIRFPEEDDEDLEEWLKEHLDEH